MSKKYIVEKGKAISTREGIISADEIVDEKLLNGNAEALIKAKIIKEIKEEKKKEDDKKKSDEDNKENESEEDNKKNEDDKKKSDEEDKKKNAGASKK